MSESLQCEACTKLTTTVVYFVYHVLNLLLNKVMIDRILIDVHDRKFKLGKQQLCADFAEMSFINC